MSAPVDLDEAAALAAGVLRWAHTTDHGARLRSAYQTIKADPGAPAAQTAMADIRLIAGFYATLTPSTSTRKQD